MRQELLRLDNVTRRITSEFYIQHVDLTLYKGEVLAFVGKNAAGKSTLAGVINGALPAESGRIWLEGREVRIPDPAAALKLGIVTLAQNQEGFDNLPVADNVLFGNDKYYRVGAIGTKKLAAVCGEAFETLGIRLDPTASFGALTPAEKQAAAIARAYLFDAKLIIMDEPSSRMPQREFGMLYNAVRALRAKGVAILYITHRLAEIPLLADRVALIEHGAVKEVRGAAGLTELDLIEAIEGFRVENSYAKETVERGESLLAVGHFQSSGVKDLSFDLHRGEIIAFLSDAGGCARSICRALCGLDPHRGEVRFRGQEAKLNSPLAADALGLVAAIDEATEEQMQNYDSHGGKSTGAFSAMSARFRDAAQGFGKTLSGIVGLRPGAEYMTGGFRQKELVQRALRREGEIYLLLDPTNGVDLRARLGIYAGIGALVKHGRGVLLFTNDPDEALGLADRILVLGEDSVLLDLPTAEACRDVLVERMTR